MSVLYVSEYAYMPQQQGVLYQIGAEPAIAEQHFTVSGTSAQSAAFNANTRFVRIHTDGIVSLLFGANPTAVTTAKRLAANQTEFFGVNPGDKVAAITNT